MKNFPHLYMPSNTARENLLLRIERLTELPLLALSFAMIPLLVGPFVWDLSSKEAAVFASLDGFIWAVFALDLGLKTAVSTHRVSYLKQHWMEVLIVAVPFLRPLRIFRIILFGSRAFRGVRRLVNVDFLLVYGIGMVMIAATLITTFEEGSGSRIDSFPNALWWAVVTITTVGYGDMVPETVAGRSVALVLMLGGIAFFSGITANLASFLVRHSPEQETQMARLTREIDLLRTEISRLRKE